jgi:hypothetical protein
LIGICALPANKPQGTRWKSRYMRLFVFVLVLKGFAIIDVDGGASFAVML